MLFNTGRENLYPQTTFILLLRCDHQNLTLHHRTGETVLRTSPSLSDSFDQFKVSYIRYQTLYIYIVNYYPIELAHLSIPSLFQVAFKSWLFSGPPKIFSTNTKILISLASPVKCRIFGCLVTKDDKRTKSVATTLAILSLLKFLPNTESLSQNRSKRVILQG